MRLKLGLDEPTLGKRMHEMNWHEFGSLLTERPTLDCIVDQVRKGPFEVLSVTPALEFSDSEWEEEPTWSRSGLCPVTKIRVGDFPRA